MKRLFRGWTAALALLAGGVPATAQPPASAGQTEPPASLFGEQIDVRVVNVEVVVTDRQGNRVANLQPGDFRLKVDGKPVPIEYFSEVRGGQVIAPPAETAAAPVPGLPALAPGSPVGTSYLVFIDDFFSIGVRRNEVLRALKDDLARLGPEDRMALVSFDGTRVEMLSSWSNSERVLSRALDEAMLRKSQGAARLAELRSFESSRRFGANPSFGGSRASFADRLDIEEIAYIDRLGQQVERAVGAAVTTLRGFAAPPGRKVMLVLSGGWPFNPADYVVNNPSRPVLEQGVPRGEEIFRPLVDTANRLGYTLYTIDVPGLDGDIASAAIAGAAPVGINVREQEIQAALSWVAEQTGGEALINANRSKALERAEADTRSYYWIGFTPGWKGNDERHEVAVEVLVPDLRVRSRDSFLDLSRKAEVSMMVESAMLFGGVPGAAPLPIEVGKPVSTGRKLMALDLALAIPVDAVTFVPIDGKYVTELELRVAALDKNGNRSDVPIIPLSLSFGTQPQAGAHVRYDTRLNLRKIAQRLIIAVYDPLSGKIITAEAEVAP
jgi:VWFA-related protein